jgi:hypothetical protein
VNTLNCRDDDLPLVAPERTEVDDLRGAQQSDRDTIGAAIVDPGEREHRTVATSERISVLVLFRIYEAACSFWMTGSTTSIQEWLGRRRPSSPSTKGRRR